MAPKRTRSQPRPARPSPPRGRPAPRRGGPARAAVPGHRIFSIPVAVVYPHYVAKAVKKGRTRDEVDRILRWLTGYSPTALDARLAKRVDFATFFAGAPRLNPLRLRVTGTICGIRVETIDDPLMREIRILDKLVDELAQGRPMEKILRTPPRA